MDPNESLDESPPSKQRKVDEQIDSTESDGQFLEGKLLRCFDRICLGECDYGPVTYHGFWKVNSDDSVERKVAVKKIKVTDCQETWKDIVDKHLCGKLSHDNVLKIIGVETDAAHQSRSRLVLKIISLKGYIF